MSVKREMGASLDTHQVIREKMSRNSQLLKRPDQSTFTVVKTLQRLRV